MASMASMASKTLGVVPVRTAGFTDYSTPQRAALRQYNEILMAEAKSQELHVLPPTANEASLQAELDETDKSLEKLEQLIKDRETDMRLRKLEENWKLEAERLREELRECKRKKSDLKQELARCKWDENLSEMDKESLFSTLREATVGTRNRTWNPSGSPSGSPTTPPGSDYDSDDEDFYGPTLRF